MFLSDLHTHTWLSIDGKETVRAMCEAAIAVGLGAIAITDHWDAFPPGMRDPGYAPHFTDSRDFWELHSARHLTEILEAKEQYRDRIFLSYGVELGQPQLFPQEAEALIASYPFDFVLCSQHLNHAHRDYYSLDYQSENIDALMRECFLLEEHVVNAGVGDALAHIDQPVRKIQGYPFDTELTAYKEEIAALLKGLIAKDMALELNTHGLRNWYGRLTPPLWVLDLYRDLGGSLVTVGSDAHYAEEVGAGIAETTAIALEKNLRVVSYYKNREPVFMN